MTDTVTQHMFTNRGYWRRNKFGRLCLVCLGGRTNEARFERRYKTMACHLCTVVSIEKNSGTARRRCDNSRSGCWRSRPTDHIGRMTGLMSNLHAHSHVWQPGAGIAWLLWQVVQQHDAHRAQSLANQVHCLRDGVRSLQKTAVPPKHLAGFVACACCEACGHSHDLCVRV